MDGGQRTRQAGGGAQFFEGQVRFFVQQHPQLDMMAGDDQGLAPGVVVARPDVAGVSPLLQEFFDHAQRHPETMGNLFPRALLLVVGRQNPFPQIQ